MSERDESGLKERIERVQALPEEAAERFLSAQGALTHAELTARLNTLYNPPKESARG